MFFELILFFTSPRYTYSSAFAKQPHCFYCTIWFLKRSVHVVFPEIETQRIAFPFTHLKATKLRNQQRVASFKIHFRSPAPIACLLRRRRAEARPSAPRRNCACVKLGPRISAYQLECTIFPNSRLVTHQPIICLGAQSPKQTEFAERCAAMESVETAETQAEAASRE
jgi:hypothetical protein